MEEHPFFRAGRNGHNWGMTEYLRSMARSNNHKLPYQDDKAFERALQFRENEKRQMRETNERCRQLHGLLMQSDAELGHAHSMLDTLNTQFSSLRQRYAERTNDRDDRAGGSGGVQDVQVRTDTNELQPEKRPTPAEPDDPGGGAHRHADEHGGEEGHGDSGVSDVVDDKPRPTGSE